MAVAHVMVISLLKRIPELKPIFIGMSQIIL